MGDAEKELEWRIEQARRIRNNKVEAMLEAYGLDEIDFVNWISECLTQQFPRRP
jgi:hypothetical protein